MTGPDSLGGLQWEVCPRLHLHAMCVYKRMLITAIIVIPIHINVLIRVIINAITIMISIISYCACYHYDCLLLCIAIIISTV